MLNNKSINNISHRIKKGSPKWKKRIIQIRRIVKVTKGGKNRRFSALVVVGNEKDKVGFGTGKSSDLVLAVNQATYNGRQNLVKILLTKNYSIPYKIVGKFGAAKVIINPKNTGSGVQAGGSVRIILELLGIQNISAKQLGCNNLLNNCHATINALNSLKNNLLI